jgi:hypothetical protein
MSLYRRWAVSLSCAALVGGCSTSANDIAATSASRPAPERSAPGDPNPAVARIVAEISRERIEANFRKLVSFGTRNSFSDTESNARGIGAARRWIKGELERCSQGTALKVEFDEHLVQGGPRVPRPVFRERRPPSRRRRRRRASTSRACSPTTSSATRVDRTAA